jgi:hypothetical protein
MTVLLPCIWSLMLPCMWSLMLPLRALTHHYNVTTAMA